MPWKQQIWKVVRFSILYLKQNNSHLLNWNIDLINYTCFLSINYYTLVTFSHLFYLFMYLLIYLLSVCLCVGRHPMAHVQRSEDIMME